MATKTRAALALWANKKSIENFFNKVNKHKKKTKKLHAITNCCDDVKVLPKGIKTAPTITNAIINSATNIANFNSFLLVI